MISALERGEREQIEIYGEETAEFAGQSENWTRAAGDRKRHGVLWSCPQGDQQYPKPRTRREQEENLVFSVFTKKLCVSDHFLNHPFYFIS